MMKDSALRGRLRRTLLSLGLVALSLAVVAPVADAATARTRRVSVRSSGQQAEAGQSGAASISANGRFVAFESAADDLVPGDGNGSGDIFVHDRKTRKTRRVSVHSDGTASVGGNSASPSISADGRYVAFESTATNLVDNDTNNERDVFVHDRKTGRTKRVSLKSNGQQVSVGGDHASISGNGRFVTFESFASDLVKNDTNGRLDIFVRDRKAKTTKRVSVRSSGVQGNDASVEPAISANGRFVTFWSQASNLVSKDNNDRRDIFVHDRQTKRTTRVSVRSNGKESNGGSRGAAISANGRYVAFWSAASNLVKADTNDLIDIFVHDRQTGHTRRVNVRSNGKQATSSSDNPSISPDGRYVAFDSFARTLVNGDTNNVQDVFIHDRKSKKTRRVSLRSGGGQANGNSTHPSVSADGRFVAFESFAGNLVSEDTNGLRDIFRRGPLR